MINSCLSEYTTRPHLTPKFDSFFLFGLKKICVSELFNKINVNEKNFNKASPGSDPLGSKQRYKLRASLMHEEHLAEYHWPSVLSAI